MSLYPEDYQNSPVVVSKAYSLTSHQTGATFSTLSDHTVEFIALVRLCTATQIANEQAPIFQDLNIFLDIARRISKHEVAFARGTRGNIGFKVDDGGGC